MKFRKFEGGSWSVFMRDFEGGHPPIVDEVFQHIIMGVFFWGGKLHRCK